MIKPTIVPFKRQFNFKKANWEMFKEDLDKVVDNLQPLPETYDEFIEATKRISRKNIPRGAELSIFQKCHLKQNLCWTDIRHLTK